MVDIFQTDKRAVFSELEKTLAEKNYAEVPFPVSQQAFVDAAQSFFSFLELPQTEKESLHFILHENDRQGYGYVRRQKGVEDKDNKEFFHYHPVLTEHFKNLPVLQDPTTVEFFSHAQTIYTACVQATNEILSAFEVEFPGIRKQLISPDGAIGMSTIRFLKYEPAGSGNFLAKGHYDRGTMTLALAESAPGLRVGKTAEQLALVTHKENTALFMPALLFSDITDARFTPAWHDVVQTSENVYRTDAARWAIVFFADAQHTTTPTLKETHTPKI